MPAPEPDATPPIPVHGRPGSVVEFLEVVGPSTDPAAHGRDPAAAFHVVVPSVPGRWSPTCWWVAYGRSRRLLREKG